MKTLKKDTRQILLGHKRTHTESELLGCTSAVKHVINTENAANVHKKPYCVPSHQKLVLDE